MAEVHIVRHKPGAVFCSTCEVVLVHDDHHIVRLVEPSGNVGTQYPNDVGSEWFGTIENLMAGLALGKASWSDVYPTATSAIGARTTSMPCTAPCSLR